MGNQLDRSSRVTAKNPMNSCPGETLSGQEHIGSVLASARSSRTSSIAIGTKEEHQIRVRVEFRVERRRIRVERDRTRVR
jgi:hypothetical protein